MNRVLPILAVLALIGFPGCARSPRSQVPALPVEVPGQYRSAALVEWVEGAGWLEELASPEVEALLVEALEANQDMKGALARLDMAQSSLRIARGARLPSADLGYSQSRQKNNFVSFSQALDEDNPLRNLITSRIVENHVLDLSVLWEIDLWGKIRNGARAALADREAAEADLHSFRFSLAARVLQAWYEAVNARERLDLFQENLDIASAQARVIRNRFLQGVPDTSLDLRLARANEEGFRTLLAIQRRELDLAVAGLEILLGRYPSGSIEVPAEAPRIHGGIPDYGVPAQLLERRPDLIAAERRLAASVERVRVARKSLLPTIGLGAGTGYTGTQAGNIFSQDFLVWNIGSNLAQPIFHGGRLVAGVSLARAAHRQALAAYAQSALAAFLEVETLMASERHLRDGTASALAALEESEGAYQLAWEQYQRGLIDISLLLETQSRKVGHHTSYLDAKFAHLVNRIRLYLALGGDMGTGTMAEEEQERSS